MTVCIPSRNLSKFLVNFFFNLHMVKFMLCDIGLFRFYQTRRGTYLLPQQHTHRFHHPPKSLCSPVAIKLSYFLKPLAANDLFSVSVILPFLECHRNGITQYVAFGVWLLSLRKMHMRIIHVVAWIITEWNF